MTADQLSRAFSGLFIFADCSELRRLLRALRHHRTAAAAAAAAARASAASMVFDNDNDGNDDDDDDDDEWTGVRCGLCLSGLMSMGGHSAALLDEIAWQCSHLAAARLDSCDFQCFFHALCGVCSIDDADGDSFPARTQALQALSLTVRRWFTHIGATQDSATACAGGSPLLQFRVVADPHDALGQPTVSVGQAASFLWELRKLSFHAPPAIDLTARSQRDPRVVHHDDKDDTTRHNQAVMELLETGVAALDLAMREHRLATPLRAQAPATLSADQVFQVRISVNALSLAVSQAVRSLVCLFARSADTIPFLSALRIKSACLPHVFLWRTLTDTTSFCRPSTHARQRNARVVCRRWAACGMAKPRC